MARPKPGPKPLMTPEAKKRLIMYLTSGLSEGDCFRALNIARQTVKRECEIDPEFGHSFKTASHDGKAKLVTRVFAASGEAWQAAAWILARKYPGEWSENKDHFTPEDVASLGVSFAELARRFIPESQHESFLNAFQALMGSISHGKRRRK